MDKYKLTYLTGRRVIGILGTTLPIILVIGGIILNSIVKESISAYYYTNMREILTGILFTIGFFFFIYPGYQLIDKILLKLSWVFAIGIAIFPVNPGTLSHTLHLISAALMFIVLSYISLFLFTKTNKNIVSKEKKRRNIVYIICGINIIILLIAIALSRYYMELNLKYKLVLIFESLLLWNFGISWAVKGQIILKDKSS